MADNWFNSLFKTKSSLQDEVKSLREKLDDIDPKNEYTEKFFDIEPGTASHINHFEFGGIDQMINDAVLTALYATETWVYTAVTAVAKTVAGLPLKLEKRTKIKETVISDITGLEEQIESEKWTEANGEKLFDRFQYPNKYTTKSEFLMLAVIDLLSTGQYFIYLDSDEDLSAISNAEFDNDPESQWGRLRDILASNTKIKGMYRLPPAITKPIPKEDGYGIEGYVMQSEAGQFVFDCAEVIHVKFPNPLNMYIGLSPLVAAFKPVLLDRFSTEHMVRFYKTGARLGGLIETEQKMNKEQLSRFQRSFENNFTGRHNFHRTLILPPGMSYKQIEQNPAETALLEFAKYNREAILAVYNVPPIKVGILDGATYANALAQLKIFFSDTVQPILTFIEDGFNLKNSLFPDTRSFRIKFDLSEVEALKENNQELATTATQMLNGGLSVNEVRKRIWKAAPVKDGDKIKIIEDMNQEPAAFPFMAAQAEEGKIKDADSTKKVDESVAALMLDVLQMAQKGSISKESAVEALVSLFGASREDASKLVGVDKITEQKDVVSNNQQLDAPAIAADIKPTGLTYSQRVTQLTELYMQRDKLPLSEAIRRAVEQAKAEGFDPEDPQPNGPSGGAPAPNSEDKLDDKPAVEQILDQPKLYAFGMTKDQVIENWKSFIDKTDPLIEKRLGEVQKFFKEFKSAIMNQVGANIKSYGFHKSRNSDDADEILDEEHYEKLLKQYAEEIDKALLEAYKTGFLDTLTTFKFDVRNEVALDTLRKYAADKIKGISDTTRDQIKQVLVEAFDEGVAVNEVAARINEKFAEINAGRAMTIARTETLTAVSMGQEAKREEFKEQFPGTPLKKMWVSAQDDKVRDSHVELDGQSVGVDEEFKEGLRFPRDPNGEAEEVINCRCTILTFAEEDQAQVEDTLGVEEEKSAQGHKKKVNRQEDETLDECVKRAIPILIQEGMSQEQAIAAAYSMCEIPRKGGEGIGGAREGAGRPRGSGNTTTSSSDNRDSSSNSNSSTQERPEAEHEYSNTIIGEHSLSANVQRGYNSYREEIAPILKKAIAYRNENGTADIKLTREERTKLRESIKKFDDTKQSFLKENGMSDQQIKAVTSMTKSWVEDSDNGEAMVMRSVLSELTGGNFNNEYYYGGKIKQSEVERIQRLRSAMEKKVGGRDNLVAAVKAEIAFNQAMYKIDHGDHGMTVYRGLVSNSPPKVNSTEAGEIKSGAASSWSTAKKVALNFAGKEESNQPLLFSKKVKPEEVVMYYKASPAMMSTKLGLGEGEIIVKSFNNKVGNVRIDRLQKAKTTEDVGQGAVPDIKGDFESWLREGNEQLVDIDE